MMIRRKKITKILLRVFFAVLPSHPSPMGVSLDWISWEGKENQPVFGENSTFPNLPHLPMILLFFLGFGERWGRLGNVKYFLHSPSITRLNIMIGEGWEGLQGGHKENFCFLKMRANDGQIWGTADMGGASPPTDEVHG